MMSNDLPTVRQADPRAEDPGVLAPLGACPADAAHEAAPIRWGKIDEIGRSNVDPTWPRLAVVGTPRSGNTWLRRLLATAYGLDDGRGREAAVHDRKLFDWEVEKGPFIVQIHLRYAPALSERFRDLGIRPLVLSRHPFDVLISILQYATHAADQSAHWLSGEAGNEDEIRGLDPCHPRFLDYATSDRARLLLGISPSWQDVPTTIALKYEDLVGDTERTLARVGAAIGQAPPEGWTHAVAANSLDSMRRAHGRGHVWKGVPGLWRRLLTPDAYDRLAKVYLSRIRDPGDGTQPNYRLTKEQALANWRAIL